MGTVSPNEKEIEKLLLRFLEAHKIFAWKNNSVGVFDPTKKVFRKAKSKYAINGVSDILGVFKGRFLAIEVKTPTIHKTLLKNQSELINYMGLNKTKLRYAEQMRFLGHIKTNGGVAFFASSIDDLKRELSL